MRNSDSEISGMRLVYYNAWRRLIWGSSWRHRPAHREALIARCRKALEGIL
jgi:hypothetical protein